MCGRAALPDDDVVAAHAAQDARWVQRGAYTSSKNAAPGSFVAVVRAEPADGAQCAVEGAEAEGAATPQASDGKEPGSERHSLLSARWGLLPPGLPASQAETADWFRMFNARGETLLEKPIFARLLSRPDRRCVVLLSGFFEWREEGSGSGGKVKQPYFVSSPQDGDVLRVAALFDICPSVDGEEEVATVTMVTRPCQPQLEWLHDRSPLLLTEEEAAQWLTAPLRVLRAHVDGGAVAGPLRTWPVSMQLNKLGSGLEGAEATREVPREVQKNAGSVAALFAARVAGGGPSSEPAAKRPKAAAPSPPPPAAKKATPKKGLPPGQRSLAAFLSQPREKS